MELARILIIPLGDFIIILLDVNVLHARFMISAIYKIAKNNKNFIDSK